MNIELRVADDDATRAAAYRLRYDVFVRERRTSPPDADHVAVRIRDSLDVRGVTMAAVDTTTHAVVGTARTNLLIDGSVPVYPALYRLTDLAAGTWAVTSVTTYVAISASRRRSGIGVELAASLFRLRLARGIKFDYLDCPNDLVPYFTRLGYRWLRAIRHPWFGATHLMRLALDDGDHLAAMHSPLVAKSRITPPDTPPE
jgi:GNAT superfamily N-acetyltransferase